MRQSLLTTAFLFFSFIGFGQCPTEPLLEITSQSQLDNFSTNYPDCTILNNNIRISGTDIVDVSGLAQLTYISGLYIENNPTLESLDGLENLTDIAGLYIRNNPVLVDFDGTGNAMIHFVEILNNQNLSSLNGLLGIDGQLESLTIRENPSLVNLQGLNTCTGVVHTDFLLENNEALTSLSGIENMTIIGNLIVRDNDALVQLDALNTNLEVYIGLYLEDNLILEDITNLESVTFGTLFEQLQLLNNPSLSICNSSTICDYILGGGSTSIQNNDEGCLTISQVSASCGEIYIPDPNFLQALTQHNPPIDLNTDTIIQLNEAEAFTGTLNVASKVISDFTGLEAFINITGFDGSGNFISELSLEENTAVTSVDFSNNPDLRKVFLKNGNNTAITNFNGVDCPSLEFICVDDVAFAEANFTSIDPQVQFVDDCELLIVEDFNLADAVSVFPNPVSETLSISTTSNINFTKAEIYSIHGQKLVETSATQINFSEFSSGVYFVKIVSGRGTITKKIIKK